MPVAYSYIRWSSAQQSDGDSERRQTEAAEAYAQANGLTLSDQRFIDPGVSAIAGKNAVEGELAAFIRAVDDGRITKGSYLLIENFDRLSRAPVLTAFKLFQDIVSRDITIVTLHDQRIYNTQLSNENWPHLMIVLANMAAAHEEQKKKGERVKKAWDNKRKLQQEEKVIASKNGPIWCTLSDDRKTWLVDQDKADIVRKIFRLALDGHGALKIANILNETDTPTVDKAKGWIRKHVEKFLATDPATLKGEEAQIVKRIHEMRSDGMSVYEIMRTLNEDGVRPIGKVQGWIHGGVAQILKQESVFGRFKQSDGDVVVDSYYPVIVSKEDFDAVQAGRKGRAGKGSRRQEIVNIFSGMCYCAYCGSRLKLLTSGTRRKQKYLMCVSKVNGTGCTAAMMPYYPMQKAILERLLMVQNRDMLPKQLDKVGESRIAAIEQQIILKQTEQEKLVSIASLVKSDVVVVADKLSKNQEELDRLQAELVAARETPITPEEVRRGQELFEMLVQNDDPELRMKVQVALRRQMVKVEAAARCDLHSDWLRKAETFLRPHEKLNSPTHLVVMHFASGTVRTLDVTRFYKESIAENKPKTRISKKMRLALEAAN